MIGLAFPQPRPVPTPTREPRKALPCMALRETRCHRFSLRLLGSRSADDLTSCPSTPGGAINSTIVAAGAKGRNSNLLPVETFGCYTRKFA